MSVADDINYIDKAFSRENSYRAVIQVVSYNSFYTIRYSIYIHCPFTFETVYIIVHNDYY